MTTGRLTREDLRRTLEETIQGRAVEDLTAGEALSYLKALFGLDNWREALAASTIVVERYPEDLDLGCLHGRILFRAGRLLEQKRFLADLFRRFPDHPALSLELAKMYLGSRDPDLAAKFLRLAREREPLHPEVLLTLGHVRFFANHFDDAAIYYERYLEVAPAVYPFEFASELIPSFLGISQKLSGRTLHRLEWPEDLPARLPMSGSPFHLAHMTIDGETFKILVDTGGGMFLMLDPAAFKAAGGEVIEQVTLHGIGGRHPVKVPIGTVPRLALGGLVANDCLVIALDLQTVSAHLGERIDGILGPGWLLSTSMTFDLVSQELFLEPSVVLPPEKQLELDQSEVLEETPDERTIRLPFYLLQDSKLLIPVGIRGSTFWFLLDSGAERTFLSMSLF